MNQWSECQFGAVVRAAVLSSGQSVSVKQWSEQQCWSSGQRSSSVEQWSEQQYEPVVRVSVWSSGQSSSVEQWSECQCEAVVSTTV